MVAWFMFMVLICMYSLATLARCLHMYKCSKIWFYYSNVVVTKQKQTKKQLQIQITVKSLYFTMQGESSDTISTFHCVLFTIFYHLFSLLDYSRKSVVKKRPSRSLVLHSLTFLPGMRIHVGYATVSYNLLF